MVYNLSRLYKLRKDHWNKSIKAIADYAKEGRKSREAFVPFFMKSVLLFRLKNFVLHSN